ncbi:hypothetical protein [Modestobacter sp. NPDC049651]|uniref:hypothetical protein n=1 Tax=unclassified Modestobacter TaxID=2643866 RepID=UPI0033D0D35A
MLTLTPTPLETAAERAFFAELAGWDTGGAVRGAVMASLPLVEDGPMQRRVADAVLFVPEGVAVVRVVEVVRQSGVVTASPDGAWTIGPGEGPGEVLQLSGGGSTPLEGLMRAGMDAAMKLRGAGLAPGRIARLTVLTGAVTGLLPGDGDLGEGDQVALLDPRSLLLGVARASRYAGTDNPRLWTTADVRAAIEALGVAGRSPSVEELNVEGFPYSPYVLRRPDLLTPASLAASKPAVAAAPTSTAAPQRTAPAGPLVDPAAAARVAAAAVQAQEAAEAEAQAQQDRAVVAAPPAPTPPPAAPTPPADVTVPAELRSRPQDTLALPTEAAGPPRAEDTGGLGGLFGAPGEEGHQPAAPVVMPYQLRPVRGPQTAPHPVAAPGAAPAGGGRRRRTGLVLGLVALLVVVVALVGVVVLRGDGSDDGGRPAASTTSPAAPSGPRPGDTQVVGGTTFTLRVTDTVDTCRGHAYGAVAGFFDSADCTGLGRALWAADAGGQPAVVSIARVTMPDESIATALLSLVNSDGTGNVSDLLREGRSYPGGPSELPGNPREFASRQDGATVTIVETAWAGSESGTGAALDALASDALTLTLPGE